MPLDVSKCANWKRESLSSLLISKHFHLRSPVQRIVANIQIEGTPMLSFSMYGNKIEKCRFKMSRLNTTCVPSNGQSRTFRVTNATTNAKALMCPEDDLLREHRILNNYLQEEHAEACIYDRVEIISELYDGGKRETYKTSF